MTRVGTIIFLCCVLCSVASAQELVPADAAVDVVAAAVAVPPTPVVEALAPGNEAIALPEPSGVSQILSTIIEIIAAALGLLLIWLTKNGISFLEKKTKIDIPHQTEEMIADWAEKGVYYATEKAHQYLLEHGEKMKGPEKLDAALKFALSLADEHKLSTIAKEKLVKYIEARLGMDRDA